MADEKKKAPVKAAPAKARTVKKAAASVALAPAGPRSQAWLIAAVLLFGLGALAAWSGAGDKGILFRLSEGWSKPVLSSGGASMEWLTGVATGSILGIYLQMIAAGLLVFWAWPRPAQTAKFDPFSAALSLLELVMAVLLLHFLMAYLIVAARRFGYAYELEFMEGTQVDMVRRILAGKSLYAEPTADYVSVVYPPLFFYVGAAISKVVGVGFGALRGLSLASIVGSFGLAALIVRRETGRWVPALVTVGLFAGCFPFSGYWYDIARVDSFSVFLTLAGVVALRLAVKPRHFVWAGLVFSAAVLVKQSAAVVIPFMLPYLWLRQREGLKPFLLTGLVLGLVSALAMHIGSGGWSTYYLLKLPGKWVVNNPGGLGLFSQIRADFLWGFLASLLALGALWARRDKRDQALFYTLMYLGFMYTVHKGFTIQGAWLNHLILFHIGAAIIIGLGMAALPELPVAPVFRLAMLLLLLVQASRCVYDPQRAVPADGARVKWDKLIAAMKDVKGEVLLPFHGYLPSLAGKQESAFVLYANAILIYLPQEDKIVRRLQLDIESQIRAKRYAAIITDGYGWSNMVGTIEQYYDGKDFEGPPPAITGWQVAPNKWYTPKPDAPAKKTK